MTLNEQFEVLDHDTIAEYVTEGQEENLHLDFKVVNGADLGYRDDRKNFAKAVSGFANSSGGIIVWGVEANDKNADGIDCASGIQEIDNLDQFISKLNEYTGDASSPIVEGVLHKPIPTQDGKGFAVTLIPESITGPHMAKLGEDRYYKRSGDSFYKMEHFDIQDMFGRRRRPNLNLIAEPKSINGTTRANSSLQILLSIKNSGRATAKAPFLAITLPGGTNISTYGVDGNYNHGLPKIDRHAGGNREHHFGSNQQIVIHPGSILDVTKIDTSCPQGVMDIEEVKIGYVLVAEDMKMEESTVTVTQADIYNFLQSRDLIEEE